MTTLQTYSTIARHAYRLWLRAMLRGRECILPTFRFAVTRKLRPFRTGSGYSIENRQQLICWWDHHIDGRLYKGWSVNPGETVLDIGSNYGVFGWEIAMRYPQARIIGFEPYAGLADYCRDLGVYERMFACALSENDGWVSLFVRQFQGSFTATIEDYPGCTWEPECEKPTGATAAFTNRLDDYNLENIGAVKIDVDGGEMRVLRGGLKTLRAVRHVICELCDQARLNEFSELLERKPIKLTDVDYLFNRDE